MYEIIIFFTTRITETLDSPDYCQMFVSLFLCVTSCIRFNIKKFLGDTEPTSGTATVSGFNIKTQLSDARRNIGYCPQFDALNPLLTGREHLRFYARLRGLSENAVKKVSSVLLLFLW